MRILDVIIIILFVIIGYCYVLYPVLIRILAKLFPKPSIKDESFRPTVSIILAVYNEELVIKRCIESLLALDYPKELLEIIIGSDASTDKTNILLSEYHKKYDFITPHYFTERRGKMLVLNELISGATGEILFFADADITLSSNTLKAQVRHFANPEIGAVGGGYAMHNHTSEAALYQTEKVYASVDQNIRIQEGLFSSTINVFGGNYSYRRIWWHPLPDSLVHDDTFIVYHVLEIGKRVFYEPESVSTEIYNRSLKDEFRRKSRSASRGYHTLSYFPDLLGFSGGKNAFLIWSHKILRWVSPLLFMFILLLSLIGLFVFGSSHYIFLLALFSLAGVITVIGLLCENFKIHIPLVSSFTWFVIMNFAYIAGTMKFLTKTDKGIWQQSTRSVFNATNPPVKEVPHNP